MIAAYVFVGIFLVWIAVELGWGGSRHIIEHGRKIQDWRGRW